MKHSERKETPAMEARMHPKKFLIAALRRKDPIGQKPNGHETQCKCKQCS